MIWGEISLEGVCAGFAAVDAQVEDEDLAVADLAGATLEIVNDACSTIMLDPKFLEDISAKISALIAKTPAADIEKNLRALLLAQFSKLDLVTREDFEVQKALLAKARERLAAVDARLAEIEDKRPGE